MMKVSYDKRDRIIAYVEIVGALLITGFWIGWYAGILKSFQLGDPLYEVYIAFESSFPIADSWIIILLLVSAVGILKENRRAPLIATAAGGSLVFLGLIDASFNLQQGVYLHDPLSILINLSCLLGGIFLVLWFALKVPE